MLGRRRTKPCHPKGNGLAERTNRVIKNILQGLVKTIKNDRWDDVLQLCMMAYPAIFNTTKECSPAYLNLGLELHLPTELTSPSAPMPVADPTMHTQTLQKRLQGAFRHVRKVRQKRKCTKRKSITGRPKDTAITMEIKCCYKDRG